jgi:uncharacterized protein (DUF58 family)
MPEPAGPPSAWSTLDVWARATRWSATAAHLRACVIALLFGVAAVLLGRPDMLVLAAPLAALAVWATVRRPAELPDIGVELAHSTLREGEATRWRATVGHTDGVESVVVRLATSDRWQLDPPSGIVALEAPADDAPLAVSVDVRSVLWGTRPIAPALLALHAPWGAFRFGPVRLEDQTLVTLPLPAVFDTSAPVPSPAGLIGLHRSRRRGDGTEFAIVRPFTTGDRLRRIHWPVTLRTGGLHVSATHTDSDTNVLIVLDATIDAGISEGVDGAASSLDRAVRGAGAIADHFLRHGDGVALRSFGSAQAARIPVGTGTRHLRRVLDELARVEPGLLSGRRIGRAQELSRLGFLSGGLVIILSPLLSAPALEEAVALVRHGLVVLVVDTLPEALPSEPGDPALELAWRVRMLERERDLRRLQEVGVPIVPWRGPGTLDQVLRDLGRRAAAPRLVRR